MEQAGNRRLDRRAAAGVMLAGALVWVTAVVDAGQTQGQFNVTVNLQPPGSQGAFCRTGPSVDTTGALVTVVCSTGAQVDIAPARTGMPWTPMHGGAYRYGALSGSTGQLFGMVDTADTGVGTTTSWRMVSLTNRDYLEITVTW